MPPKRLAAAPSGRVSKDRFRTNAPVNETFFVPYQPPSVSKRQVEIVDAARRAYIARRWHSKRQASEEKGHASLDREQSENARHLANDTISTSGTQVAVPRHVPLSVRLLQTVGNALDPFDSLGLTMNTDTANLLRYFELTWSPVAFQPATQRDSVGRPEEQYSLQLVRNILADALVSEAFLAAVAMRMTTVHSARSEAATHASRALTSLRLLVGNEVDNSDRILLTILFLAAFETYCFNLEGTRSHLRALRFMGAHKRLNGYFRMLCEHVDLFSAAAALKVPIMPPSRRMSLLSGAVNAADNGFVDAPELADPTMQDVIRDILLCARAAEAYKSQAQQAAPSHETPHQIIAQSESLTYQLLHQLPGSPPKEACIIALLMWLSYLPVSIMTHLTHPTPPPQQDLLKILPGRGTGLVNRLKASSPLTTHLHLWILAVGVVCAIDAEDTGYCAVEFVHIARRLGVVDVQVVLRRFLWLDDFDRIDGQLLEELLGNEEVSRRALRTVVEWSRTTKGGDGGGGRASEGREMVDVPMRITKRPSNRYRLGA